MTSRVAAGAGLGFRRELMEPLRRGVPPQISFFELAPENWVGMGGRSARDLRAFTERYPFVCHGLSLSLGGPGRLDEDLLHATKNFMTAHGINLYTEHLSWCADDHHLYDLLPIPLTQEAVKWTADRIGRVQDILGMRIGVENVSYYLASPHAEMQETDFIQAVVREADCLLHLDVNNIYVNSQNFGFDPLAYLHALPLERTCYIHVAGHYREPDGFLIDTHGADVADPVWALLRAAYDRVSAEVPTCLERDFHFADVQALAQEVGMIQRIRAEITAAAGIPFSASAKAIAEQSGSQPLEVA